MTRYMIVNPRHMRGRPAADVLSGYAQIALQLSSFFYAKELTADMRKLSDLKAERSRRQEELERLDVTGLIGRHLAG